MSELYLNRILPPTVLARIHRYLYNPITQKYIKNQMQAMNHYPNSALRWQLLIRDSKDIIIQLPEHELQGFNFSSFLYHSITTRNIIAELLPKFHKFCIQTIQNSPNLIFNRYYVGNGGSPVCQMISTFLVRNQINGSYFWSVPGIQQVLFDVLIHARKCGCFQNFNNVWKLMYSLQLSYFVTQYTVQTVQFVLQLFWTQLQKEINSGRQFHQSQGVQGQFYYSTSIQRFFQSLFSIYTQQKHNKNSYRWQYVARSKQQLIHSYFPKIKKVFHEIIQLLNNKFSQFVYKFRAKVSYALRKVNNMQLIVQLIYYYQSFRNIIFSQQFVFFAFNSKNSAICELLWHFRDERKTICNMRNEKDLNLLQTVAKNYGLTHNIIKMLWSSGYFTTMPEIKNKKSNQILHQWLQLQEEK